MQIPVTNQNTKWIRPASRDAGSGSQPGMRANADAIAPAKTPITISWTIEPLRTDAASLLKRSDRVRRFSTGRVGESNWESKEVKLGLGVGILLIADGAILTFAVKATSSSVNVEAVG